MKTIKYCPYCGTEYAADTICYSNEAEKFLCRECQEPAYVDNETIRDFEDMMNRFYAAYEEYYFNSGASAQQDLIDMYRRER